MQKQPFQQFMGNLIETIATYSFFVNWEKVTDNVKTIEKRLNILNYLIGKEDMKTEFYGLLKEYPEVISVFPILLATRDKEQTVLNERIELDKYDFSKTALNEADINVFYKFFVGTGLERLLKEKKVKNLVDYVFGVEVGMDTNARKNRTGIEMENRVETYIKKLCGTNPELSYLRYATKNKIFRQWGYSLEIDKTDRDFDFAIYNKKTKKIFPIEVNFYGGGGTKLKSTAGEYQILNDFLKKQGIDLIWITDGFGWKTAKRALEETFIHNTYVLNLSNLKENLLQEIING